MPEYVLEYLPSLALERVSGYCVGVGSCELGNGSKEGGLVNLRWKSRYGRRKEILGEKKGGLKINRTCLRTF